MLWGLHRTNRWAGASPLCIPLLHLYCNSGHSTHWRVHRSECKWRTHLENFFSNCPPARKLRHTMLGDVIIRTDRQEPLHYTFHCYMYTVISAIAILEGAQVGVHRSECKQRMQILVSCPPVKELRDRGVHHTNRRAGARTEVHSIATCIL